MRYSFLLLVPLVATQARAQIGDYDYGFTSLTTWAVSVPLGDTKRFVGSPSWTGITWAMQWNREKMATGFELGLHDFYDQSTGTTTFGSGAATGSQFRDLLVTTAMATARWYPFGSGRGPSLGIGGGGMYAQQSYQLGIQSQLIRSGFQFAIAPEAAMAIPIFHDISAVLTARYMAPTSADGYLGGGSRRFRFLTISAGFAER